MAAFDKKELSERDICSKFITPAIVTAGWDLRDQLREEVPFTKGRVIVRGNTIRRGEAKRADYLLYYKPNLSIAVMPPSAWLTLHSSRRLPPTSSSFVGSSIEYLASNVCALAGGSSTCQW